MCKNWAFLQKWHWKVLQNLTAELKDIWQFISSSIISIFVLYLDIIQIKMRKCLSLSKNSDARGLAQKSKIFSYFYNKNITFTFSIICDFCWYISLKTESHHVAPLIHYTKKTKHQTEKLNANMQRKFSKNITNENFFN